MGLSNMCNIAHVKTTNNSNFFLESNNYLFKRFIFNIKCTNSNTKLYFNLLNMCKFAHDRKTLKILSKVLLKKDVKIRFLSCVFRSLKKKVVFFVNFFIMFET